MLPFYIKRTAIASAALWFALPHAAQAVPQRASVTPTEVINRLSANAGGRITTAITDSESYSLILAQPGSVLMSDDVTANPEARARFFMATNGAFAGISDSAGQLKLQRIGTDVKGNKHVHLDQVQGGVPVFGARVVVHMNNQGIIGMNGVFLKDVAGLSTTPALDVATLRSYAVATP